jgi:hypothetical protein
METKFIFLLGLAVVVACAMNRAQGRSKPAWSQHLKGWQRVFGAVAVFLALLVILNPEFLALGLLGDTAFFDLLVLSLGLQMHTLAARAFRACANAWSKWFGWLVIPSPGLRYVVAVSTVVIASVVSAFQKAVQRFFS